MKLLSVAIPCYNSENYMEHCIQTLLTGGEEVEILIVDDGSKNDRTGLIADQYQQQYPTICRAIHQENGGHGQAVNTGLSQATGTFFKVVDSDDWVNEEAFQEILNVLRIYQEPESEENALDMLVSNFVYEKQGAKRKKVMNYRTAFPKNELFSWEDVRFFMKGQYILMHSVIYRTSMLRDCGLKLPMHTFYVDNIFVYHPLPHVRRLYYLDVNFYRYFIGREDQSVNESVMIGRIDQQLLVTKLMLGYYDVIKLKPRQLRHYMISYLEIMMTISSMLAIQSDNPENFKKKKELWQYLRRQNLPLFIRLRWGFLGQGVNLPGKSGRKIFSVCYKITRKFYGFN
ncbi:MAG: glycosyltransferase [Lachnospiraceae bacterium]|jgi:glycosyltransferase involved in cell wall biosynthesis|nr:glycosyltransferase [Lachnospiraceae bacterium]